MQWVGNPYSVLAGIQSKEALFQEVCSDWGVPEVNIIDLMIIILVLNLSSCVTDCLVLPVCLGVPAVLYHWSTSWHCGFVLGKSLSRQASSLASLTNSIHPRIGQLWEATWTFPKFVPVFITPFFLHYSRFFRIMASTQQVGADLNHFILQ